MFSDTEEMLYEKLAGMYNDDWMSLDQIEDEVYDDFEHLLEEGDDDVCDVNIDRVMERLKEDVKFWRGRDIVHMLGAKNRDRFDIEDMVIDVDGIEDKEIDRMQEKLEALGIDTDRIARDTWVNCPPEMETGDFIVWARRYAAEVDRNKRAIRVTPRLMFGIEELADRIGCDITHERTCLVIE